MRKSRPHPIICSLLGRKSTIVFGLVHHATCLEQPPTNLDMLHDVDLQSLLSGLEHGRGRAAREGELNEANMADFFSIPLVSVPHPPYACAGM